MRDYRPTRLHWIREAWSEATKLSPNPRLRGAFAEEGEPPIQPRTFEPFNHKRPLVKPLKTQAEPRTRRHKPVSSSDQADIETFLRLRGRTT